MNNNIHAPVLALDLGEKRVGVAVSDALSISITRLKALPRTNWKKLLRDVEQLVQRFDAQSVVIGLPLRLDSSYGDAALKVRTMAEKFAQSLRIPIYLQDERLTSTEARQSLLDAGHPQRAISELVDSEAAALILRDFLAGSQHRVVISTS